MVLGIVFLLLLFADQVSKAVAYAIPLREVTIIPGLLQLNYLPGLNTGMAWGWLKDWDFAQPFLIIVTCVALIVMLVLLLKLQRHKRFLRYSLVVIMAGAAGNLVDRIVDGGVRDFIDISVGDISFLNFNCNVADVAVTVGAVMLILALLFVDRDSLVRSLLHNRREKAEVLDAAAKLEDSTAVPDNDIGSSQTRAAEEGAAALEREARAKEENDERGG